MELLCHLPDDRLVVPDHRPLAVWEHLEPPPRRGQAPVSEGTDRPALPPPPAKTPPPAPPPAHASARRPTHPTAPAPSRRPAPPPSVSPRGRTDSTSAGGRPAGATPSLRAAAAPGGPDPPKWSARWAVRSVPRRCTTAKCCPVNVRSAASSTSTTRSRSDHSSMFPVTAEPLTMTAWTGGSAWRTGSARSRKEPCASGRRCVART